MTDAPLHAVVGRLRSLNLSEPERCDEDLLRAFLGGRDERAFAAIVRRHGPLVLGVCRRVLGQAQDAEDAFQATFLVLARKAATLRRPALASWLHGAAYRMALSIKRAGARRRAHEGRAKPMTPTNPATEMAWREIEGLVEDEIQKLPEKYRMVFVLCCQEGRSRAEVAQVLGLKEGTVSSRLDAARKQLRQRLARRGVALAAVLATAALARPAGAAVPASLGKATVRAGVVLASGQAAVGVPARVMTLVEGALRSSGIAPVRVLLALVIGLGTLTAGAGLVGPPTSAGPPTPKESAPSTTRAAVLARPPRTDLYGDPLPLGAIARLGTVRFRHGSTVTGLAFAPDGRTLLSASYDKTVRVWDPTTGREIRRLPRLRGSANSLCLSRDGRTLALIEYTGTIYVGDLLATRLAPPDFLVREICTCVGLSPDGRVLAVGSDTFAVRLLEPASGRLLHTCEGHRAKVTHAVFAPDGQSLATASEDGTWRRWEVATGREIVRHEGKLPVTAVAFSPDGKLVATGGGDGRVRIWPQPNGKPSFESPAQGLPVEAVAFAPDGRTLAAAVNGLVTLWDVTTGKERHRLWGAGSVALAFAPDGRTLATGGHDSVIRLWDVATGREHRLVGPSPYGWVKSVAISADGKVVATSAGGQRVGLWDLPTGRPRRMLANVTSYGSLALSPDGKLVASDGGLWSAETGKLVTRFPTRGYGVEGIALAPDGRTLALGTRDASPKGHVCLWDVKNARELRRFGTQPVFALAFAPDGKILAAANQDGTLGLWDLAQGKEIERLSGHRREADSVAFSLDGRLLASGSFDGDLFLWDRATGKPVRPLVRDGASGKPQVLGVAFSPDGRMLASAEESYSSNGGASVTLWEVATGRVRLRLTGHEGDVTSLAFAPGGRLLVTGGSDSTALVWDVAAAAAAPPAGPSRADLESRWGELRSSDAAVAYRAVCALAASAEGVRFLGERLPPAPVGDDRRTAALIQALDAAGFEQREEAARALAELGEEAEPALRLALAARPSLETQRRLERLLERLAPEGLRERRAVEALEQSATPQARQVLQTLAQGAPNARRTQEARAALARLGHK